MQTVPATPEMVPFLLARMGEERIARMRAVGIVPETVIVREIEMSAMTWCGMAQDGVVNLGGIAPMPDGAGYLWQYITPAVRQHKREYLAQGKEIQAAAFRIFRRVETLIETEYRAALRHARRNGLAIGPVMDFRGIAVHRCEGWRL